MSHHNNQEFPRVLIDELDRILVQIRQINDQAEALISRARDIAALAKRTVSENTKVHLESMKAEERIRQADQVIEREAQREVERREQAVDGGRIGPGTISSRLPWSEKAAIQTAERKILFAGAGGTVLSKDSVLGILRTRMPRWAHLSADERRAISPVIERYLSSLPEGNLDGTLEALAKSKRAGGVFVNALASHRAARDRAATIQDIADLSGEGDAARDIVRNIAEPDESDGADERLSFDVVPAGGSVRMGTGVSDLSEYLARGPIVADAIDATKIEESLPGQAEGVSTGAAEELSPQPAEAAPVNAAEETKVIPPEDSSAVAIADMDITVGTAAVVSVEDGNVVDVKDTTADWSLRQQDLGRLATTARQNANAREANEFSDKVLDMWNSTLLTEAQIAKRLATGKSLISQIVEQARVDQDPRVMGKRGVVAKMPKEHMPLSAMARKIMERPAPIAATRAGVELGKFDPPAKGGEKSSLISTGVCVVDIDNRKIYGKRGIWTADRKIVETVVKLNGGQMFGKAYLTTACGWRDEREFRDAITPMMERLRDIGIIMTSLPTGIVIRVAD